jgi:hypothetical protein
MNEYRGIVSFEGHVGSARQAPVIENEAKAPPV